MKKFTFMIAAIVLCAAISLPATTVDLVADQDIVVGTVTVGPGTDAGTIQVTYTITDTDWTLVQTHLAVEDTCDDIPAAGRWNNPVPGQFEFSDPHGPVSTYTYDNIDVTGMTEPICVAAHAVVKAFDEACIDFECDDYQEKEPVMMVPTPLGDVNFGMVLSTPLVGLLPGDTADLTPVENEYPVIAAPDTKPPLDNIVAFTVNMTKFGGSDTIRDDYVRDDRGTGAGGKTLTDPQDLSQSPLLQHAYSRLLAILIDVSDISGLTKLYMVGVDLDHTEIWHFHYFDATDTLINEIIVGPGTQNDDGAAFPVDYWDPATKKVVIWGEMNIGQRDRIGFALDNICIGAYVADETAWGDGTTISDKPTGANWGMCFQYTTATAAPAIAP
jgi:hypothetical protein